MIKITPNNCSNTLKPVKNNASQIVKPAKTAAAQVEKSLVDLRGEELGYFKFNGKVIKTIFPR